MNNALLEMVKRHEGVKKHAYQDSRGIWTIGCGRNIDESGGGLGLSEKEINFLLKNDLERCVTELHDDYPWFSDLDSVRQDALTDIIFNLGATRLRKFRRALASMALWQFEAAASHFLDSKWRVQVGERAEELAEMIVTGEYRQWH